MFLADPDCMEVGQATARVALLDNGRPPIVRDCQHSMSVFLCAVSMAVRERMAQFQGGSASNEHCSDSVGGKALKFPKMTKPH